MLDTREADEAIYNIDRTELGGRTITVVYSRESRKTPRDMIDRERRLLGTGSVVTWSSGIVRR